MVDVTIQIENNGVSVHTLPLSNYNGKKLLCLLLNLDKLIVSSSDRSQENIFVHLLLISDNS